MPSPIRLNKVLKELNISLDRAVEFLSSKKIEIEPRPTSKIDQDVYDLLLDEFQTDKSDKDKLEEINTKKRRELEEKQSEEKRAEEKQSEEKRAEEKQSEENVEMKNEKVEPILNKTIYIYISDMEDPQQTPDKASSESAEPDRVRCCSPKLELGVHGLFQNCVCVFATSNVLPQHGMTFLQE